MSSDHQFFLQEENMKYPVQFTKWALIFGAVLTVACTVSGNGGIEDILTKSYSVSPGGTLTVNADLGSIEVEAASGSSVDIKVLQQVRTSNQTKADKILKDFKVDFSQRGNDVFIEAEYQRRGWQKLWDNISKHLRIKFIISVPRVYNVDLKTSGGSISVKGTEGQVKSRTSGGSLDFQQIEGNIYGKTSGGSIGIGEVDGDVDIHTSGGSIRIARASGSVEAHTSGGSITVQEVMGAIKAHTSGGSVKAYITSQPASSCRLSTSGGSVTVFLNTDVALDINAKTSGGRVHTDFPVTIMGKIDKRSLYGKFNGGGPELHLRTSGGSIYIREK
jgi:DUF4097 and DUF4098 domain-containing protein YvlB